MSDAVQKGAKTIMVSTVDTYVVSMVSVFFELTKQHPGLYIYGYRLEKETPLGNITSASSSLNFCEENVQTLPFKTDKRCYANSQRMYR